MPGRIKVGVIQSSAIPGEAGENLEQALTSAEMLSDKGVDVVVLPEMFNSGYGVDPQTLKAAEESFEETIETLSVLADDRELMIVGGIAKKVREKWFNSVVVVRPFIEPIYYNKTHLFRDEKKLFTPGDSFVVFEYSGIRFGILMCFEIGFPEVSRYLCQKGSEVIISVFAFGKERSRIYQTATIARSIENGTFLVASSQTGRPGKTEFTGSSRIVAPSGELLADAGTAEGFILAELNTSLVKRYRYEEGGDSNGYYSNLRPELYVR